MADSEKNVVIECFRQKLENNKVIDHEDKTGLNKFKIEFSNSLYKAMNETVVDLVGSSNKIDANFKSEKPKGQFYPLYVQEMKKLNWSYQMIENTK